MSSSSCLSRWGRSTWLELREDTAEVPEAGGTVALEAGASQDAQPREESTFAATESHTCAHTPNHGQEHKDEWVETSEEAENDVSAIVSSFLLRQAVLFASTGRVPS